VGVVAYYVEYTNMVTKWYGSDCDNQGYQRRRGGVSNFALKVGVSLLVALRDKKRRRLFIFMALVPWVPQGSTLVVFPELVWPLKRGGSP